MGPTYVLSAISGSVMIVACRQCKPTFTGIVYPLIASDCVIVYLTLWKSLNFAGCQ